MRRAVVAALLLASATVAIAEPAAPEDPKQAMRDRGIVRKAGKKHYVIIVPPANPQNGVVLGRSTVYFGELGKMRVIPGESWGNSPVESRNLNDVRDLYVSEIRRESDTYSILCRTHYDQSQTERTIELTAVDAAAAADVIDKAKLVPVQEHYRALLIGRVGATTYLYVDRRGDGSDFRIFLGKRGAMKKLAIKEVANDSEGLSLVTAKGTLSMKWEGSSKVPSATWGVGKKPEALKTFDKYANIGLIYRELGVYTREPTGHPCHEL